MLFFQKVFHDVKCKKRVNTKSCVENERVDRIEFSRLRIFGVGQVFGYGVFNNKTFIKILAIVFGFFT